MVPLQLHEGNQPLANGCNVFRNFLVAGAELERGTDLLLIFRDLDAPRFGQAKHFRTGIGFAGLEILHCGLEKRRAVVEGGEAPAGA